MQLTARAAAFSPHSLLDAGSAPASSGGAAPAAASSPAPAGGSSDAGAAWGLLCSEHLTPFLATCAEVGGALTLLSAILWFSFSYCCLSFSHASLAPFLFLILTLLPFILSCMSLCRQIVVKFSFICPLLGPVATQAPLFKEAHDVVANLIAMSAASKKPSGDAFREILNPLSAAITAIDKVRLPKDRDDPVEWLQKCLNGGINALTFVCTPGERAKL